MTVIGLPMHRELCAAYRDEGLVVITLLHNYTIRSAS